MKSITNAILGTATEIDAEKLSQQLEAVLYDEESIGGAFKLVRDMIVFTNCRLILVDKKGVTGKRTEYFSIPYRSVAQFSVETAGHFDLDSELKIWVMGVAEPIVKEFKKGSDIALVQKLLASYTG